MRRHQTCTAFDGSIASRAFVVCVIAGSIDVYDDRDRETGGGPARGRYLVVRNQHTVNTK